MRLWLALAAGGLVVRTIWSIIALIQIWSDRMTMEEMILSCPVEFFPMLLAIGAVIGLAVTGARSFLAFSEQDKIQARTKGQRLAYGLNYLGENIAVVIACAILTPVIAGGYYQLAASEPTFWGIVTIGLVVAFVVALIGDTGCKKILEGFRNRAKADQAIADKKKTE